MGIVRRARGGDDEVRALQDLQCADLHIGFDDLPDDDESIVVIETSDVGYLVLPDEVFEAIDLDALSDGQRRRVLTRVLTGISAAA